MANMKPPIFVLKKMIYPLEGFPRDPPQQLETDSEMLVCLHLFGGIHICTAEQMSDDLSGL